MKITKKSKVTASSNSYEGIDPRDFYFGKLEADKYGDMICERLAGQTVSKRKDLAEAPGGLIYEAERIGLDDFWDLLKALEGLCYQGRAREIDDSTYLVLGDNDYEDLNSSEDIEMETDKFEGGCVKSTENVSVKQCKVSERIEECDNISKQFGIVTC